MRALYQSIESIRIWEVGRQVDEGERDEGSKVELRVKKDQLARK